MENLENKSRAELVELAQSMGIKSVTIKRKDQLIEEISIMQNPQHPAMPADSPSPKKKRGRPALHPGDVDLNAPVELGAADLIPIPIKKGEHPGQTTLFASEEAAGDVQTSVPSDERRFSGKHQKGREKYFNKKDKTGSQHTHHSSEKADSVTEPSDPSKDTTIAQGQSGGAPEPTQPHNRHRHQRSEQTPQRPQYSFYGTKPLPVSTAPTLKERLEELEPQLGGLLLCEGTLEIKNDGVGFLRSVHYGFMPGPDDVYVSASLVRQMNLKPGDCIVGIVRPPQPDDRYFGMVRIEAINGRFPSDLEERKDFEDLLPVYPDKRFVLETRANNYLTRIIDLFAPLGKGQRGLIVAQPKTGKTTILRNIANAVSENNPETRIIILLIDERPEEVTEMERSVIDAEVVASTFDMRPENHIRVAEIVFEKARRLVESGQDVLILMDSITRLARAYNICASNTGRTMSGGIDAQALKVPRQLFSSARNIENGGSLTIIATALIETGSRMDDVIFEEFKGTGNMEIVLDRRLADRRIFPAIDVFKSGTRREELLVSDEEREKVVLLRRYLTTMNPVEAIEFILDKMKGTYDNRHFLISMNQ
jgi:transcription termination factor Rho